MLEKTFKLFTTAREICICLIRTEVGKYDSANDIIDEYYDADTMDMSCYGGYD